MDRVGSNCNTRLAAHERILPKKQDVYAQILAYGAEQGSCGLIPDEVAEKWDCSINSVAPRCTELRQMGELVATSRTRLTRSGSYSRVLVLPEFSDRGATTSAALSPHKRGTDAPAPEPSMAAPREDAELPARVPPDEAKRQTPGPNFTPSLFGDLQPESEYPD